MDLNTLLTHGLTYLAALALPLWLLGEQLAAWWTLGRPTAANADRLKEVERGRRLEEAPREAEHDVVVTVRKAA